MCEELCRLCLSKANLMPLFTNIEQNGNFSRVLFLTTGLQIKPNDGFPQNICGKCKNDVYSALGLRNRSQECEKNIIELGYQKNCENIVIYDEIITETDEIKTEVTENQNTSDGVNEDLENSCGFPELKVEVEFDQDGGETKWPLSETVTKFSRKERRQQYLDMVYGKLNPEGPVKCRICQKWVKNWKCFINHAKLHLGFKFVCEFCGKSFISTTPLKRHLRSYHGLTRELRCQYCSYLALDNTQLKLHVRRMHTLERPFICDECGSSYHSRRCLVQHIESHRPVANLQCELCPQTFKSARMLSRHRYHAHSQKIPHAVIYN